MPGGPTGPCCPSTPSGPVDPCRQKFKSYLLKVAHLGTVQKATVTVSHASDEEHVYHTTSTLGPPGP